MLSRNEDHALGQYLTEYPKNKEWDEILELVEKEDDSITVWEPFEYYPGDQMVEFITDAFWALDSRYPEGAK